LLPGSRSEVDAVVRETQHAMRDASETVLSGFPLRTEAKVVRYPERYSDPRGAPMWQTVRTVLEQLPPTALDVEPF
jgi:hypothetical protein